MCGIFGAFSSDSIPNDELEKINRNFLSQRHRGPDGAGVFQTNHLFMGMVRLSIIDEDNSWQPLWNSNKSVGLVCNGEIYNFKELREELVSQGVKFNTEGDLEVILHLYERYAEDFIIHLRGMFAFLLYDAVANKVIIGRDRLGEKPLYIYESKGIVFVSSELRSLVQNQIVPVKINKHYLYDYLIHGFVPEPNTLLNGVRKLPAGTMEVFYLKKNERKSKTYWSIDHIVDEESANPIDEMNSLLEEIVRITSRSDVPVGLALSSGIDSNIILALASKLGIKLTCLSVGYTNTEPTDESKDASKFAKSLGFESIVVSLDPKTVAKEFSSVCIENDEPIADIAASGYKALYKLAKENGIKVVLTGQGADELFWGYPWLQSSVDLNNRRAKLLQGRRNFSEYLKFSKPPVGRAAKLEWIRACGGFFENVRCLFEDFKDYKVGKTEVLVYARRPGARERNKIIKDVLENYNHSSHYQIQNSEYEIDVSRHVMKTIIETYLKSNGLAQMDRLSMVSSVESRSPLVDYRLAEFAVQGLKSFNKYSLFPKSILVNASKDLLPFNLFVRKKRGFTPPVKKWYREFEKANRDNFAELRIVQLGLIKERRAGILRKPITILGRPRPIWLELAVLELWIRGLERLQDARYYDG